MTAASSGRGALDRVERGLRMVTVPFPHLAGLVAATRVTLDDRLPTIGVFPSGRLAANPQFVCGLKDNELVFVLAHEMLHLALRTHDRAKGSDRLEFNYAHDYIINDILRAELGMPIPADGLDMPGAREKSAEQIVLEMRRNQQAQSKTRVWRGEAVAAGRLFGPGARAGEPADAGDVLDVSTEAELYPEDAAEAAAQAERVREMAAKALGLARAMGLARGLRGTDAGAASQTVMALRGIYRTPWKLALQRWIESHKKSAETFTLALFDLDDFRQINNGFGHQIGNQILAHAALELGRNIRSKDFLARCGGDKFAVLTSGMDLSVAEKRFSQMLRILEAARLRCRKMDQMEYLSLSFTASCGVAEYALQESARELLSRVHDALYEAKRLGKNRIIANLYL